MKNKRIGVLMGGLSSEREVSLESGAGAIAALRERGYDVVAIDWRAGTSLATLLTAERVEVVWNALHGTYGEDGAVQGLCACLGISCTGSGILASALAMDKVASKRIFDSFGIATPRWRVIEGSDVGDFAPPMVIKPAREGSSVGVSVVREERAIAAAIATARAHEGPTLIEEFIEGPELCVGVLGSQVIGSLEIRPASGFYDYEAKYVRDDTQYLIPVPLPAAVLACAEALALAAYCALDCSGYGRVDLRIDKRGAPFVLEVNTLPGMTSHSLLPKIAAHAGIDYGTLCERILASAH